MANKLKSLGFRDVFFLCGEDILISMLMRNFILKYIIKTLLK